MIKLPKERSIKIILIGDYAVGKTSVRRNYMGETFQTNYLPTIGCDFSFKRIRLQEQGEAIKVLIWDLAGDSAFKKIHSQFYKGAHGAIIMYDVTSRKSFQNIVEWVETFYSEIRPHKPPIMIVGNKIDLLGSHETEKSSFVTVEEENQLVQEIKERYNNEIAVLTSRTSAKTGENIETMFTRLVNQVEKWLQRTKFNYMKTFIRSKTIDELLTFANIFVFHEGMGPLNIISTPMNRLIAQLKTSDFIHEGIKIFAIHDFEMITNQRILHGQYPWQKPQGTYMYIIFTIPNSQAKAKEELHIVGIHISKSLNDVITFIEPIVLGYLYQFLNNYVHMLEEHQLRFAHKKNIKLPNEMRTRLLEELENLRNHIYIQLLTLF